MKNEPRGYAPKIDWLQDQWGPIKATVDVIGGRWKSISPNPTPLSRNPVAAPNEPVLANPKPIRIRVPEYHEVPKPRPPPPTKPPPATYYVEKSEKGGKQFLCRKKERKKKVLIGLFARPRLSPLVSTLTIVPRGVAQTRTWGGYGKRLTRAAAELDSGQANYYNVAKSGSREGITEVTNDTRDDHQLDPHAFGQLMTADLGLWRLSSGFSPILMRTP